MEEFNVLDVARLRNVRVWLDYLPAPLDYTCYDQGEGVCSRKDGKLWLRVVSIPRSRSENYHPTWLAVAALGRVRQVREEPWPPKETGE